MEPQDHHKLLERIISSKSFGKSGTYANLLKYLVNCTLNQNVPKETTIASEIFGRTDFDPSQNTLVRVYVYNLRKKLEVYYENEGKHEKKRLRIPKGSYEIEFVANKATPKLKKQYPLKTIIGVLLFLLLLSLFFNLKTLNGASESVFNTSELWKGVLSDQQPLTVVIGDLFIYDEIDTINNTAKTIRHARVNSVTEFEDFVSKRSTEHVTYEAGEYTFLIYNSALWIKDLTNIFAKNDKIFAVRNMARFNPKALQDGDFMVLGMIKTFGLFRDYTETTAFPYNTEEDAIVYTDSTGQKKLLRPFGDPNAYHTDYGIIMKIPGSNSNDIYLFGGIWDTGASQSLKYFTDGSLLTELEDQMLAKFGAIPQYYEILFEVKGIDRMELNPTILEINKKTAGDLFRN
ncbi:hypothetical protein [Seonamhaeicola sp.]|uniref:hypothetical protein n=1 Tax=Seonamhaeicola sp. TaxID=1912245 RepID=UPI00262DA85F|nr:hypothetical protein [Seonamhaeicola sp.]